MQAPAFWWRPDPSPIALALAPLGWIYGALTGARMARPGSSAAVPVVCVGNLVAGGAGKTPTALALARLLVEAGRRPVFLSRGYGGSLRGPALVEPDRHRAHECGDEPLLLAHFAPTVVSADRVAGAALAARHGDVIVMDDGLQNPQLRKDLRIAVVDGASGVGNGLCIPAGPLRAPLATQWPHVDVVIVIGPGQPGETIGDAARRHGKRVLEASLAPPPGMKERLEGRRVLAFAGIGRPEKFFVSLSQAGAVVTAARPFPDHHPYTRADVLGMLEECERSGLECWTTAKDQIRLEGVMTPVDLARINVFPVALDFADHGAVCAALASVSGDDRP